MCWPTLSMWNVKVQIFFRANLWNMSFLRNTVLGGAISCWSGTWAETLHITSIMFHLWAWCRPLASCLTVKHQVLVCVAPVCAPPRYCSPCGCRWRWAPESAPGGGHRGQASEHASDGSPSSCGSPNTRCRWELPGSGWPRLDLGRWGIHKKLKLTLHVETKLCVQLRELHHLNLLCASLAT